jgi:hypothetical protein
MTTHWFGKIRAVHFAETFREKSWSVQLRLAIRKVKPAIRCSVSSCTFLHSGSRTDKLSLSNESYIFGRSGSLPPWLTGKLTNFMEHNPSWEADSSSASQQIPYVSLLRSQDTGPYPRPDHSSPTPSYFLNIRFKIILPPHPMSSKWSLSLTFFDWSSDGITMNCCLCYSAIRSFARQALVSLAEPKLHQLWYQAIYVADGSHRVLPA